MGTKLLNNKISHNPVEQDRTDSRKSLFSSYLRSIQPWLAFLGSRESLINPWDPITYISQNPRIVLSTPSTFCHKLAGNQTHNTSTIDSDNPVGNPVVSGLNLALKNPKSDPRFDAVLSLFSQTNFGIMSTIKWVVMELKGPMKNWLFYLVAAWVGLLSASAANVVVCVQPNGVARMQLTDHQCCSACCDSSCAACSVPTRESGCFLHGDECCQDVVFPFPPATVVSTVFSPVSAASPMVCDLSGNSQYNSKMPYITKGLVVCDPAVNTAILLI